MERQIATTQSQSARLLRCGVSADTADMCYNSGALSLMDYNSAVQERDSRRESYEVIPAFSLSALLGLLPPNIEQRGSGKWWFEFCRDADGLFYTGYRQDSGHMLEPTPMHTTDPFEALMPVFRWLYSEKVNLTPPICHNATVESIVEMINLLPGCMKDEIIKKLNEQ